MYDDTMLVDKSYYNKLKEHYDRFQWISVKDRLPKEEEANQPVAVHTEHGEITHWMPLPPLPEENDADV